MSEVAYDIKEQLEAVEEGLLDGESLYAVYDSKGAGTGFVGISDLRVVIQDESYVGGKIALTSLPYARVSAVSLVSNKSVFGRWVEASTLAITSGETIYEVEMRGHDKARHAHDLILYFITRR